MRIRHNPVRGAEHEPKRVRLQTVRACTYCHGSRVRGRAHPQQAATLDVSASSYLEWDLGIDSLARTELILWVERSFGVRLPGAVTGEVETVSDLLHALEQAHPSAPAAPEAVAKPFLPNVPAATEARTLVEVLEWHAAQHPHRLHLTVLEDEATTLATMTYRELAEAAREAAQGMIDQDVVKVAAEAGLPLRATKHSARSADNAAHYGRHGRLGRSESRR